MKGQIGFDDTRLIVYALFLIMTIVGGVLLVMFAMNSWGG